MTDVPLAALGAERRPLPATDPARPAFLGLTREEIDAHLDLQGAGREALGATLGERTMRALHRDMAKTPADIQNLAKAKQEALLEHFSFDRLQLAAVHPAGDGSARYAFRAADGAVIETVLLPHHGKWSACVSSQAGCAIGCRFCATAKLGLLRNLSAAEIVDQVLQVGAHSGHRISDLVFMGMGEPLHNPEQVLKAGRVLADDRGAQISPRRMKISTSGVIPVIKRFARERQKMELYFSLISAVPEKRAQLMPIQRVFPFFDLIEAIREYQASRDGKWVTLEYLCIKDYTLSAEDIEALAENLRGIRYILNLIPWNPIPGLPFESPSREEVQAWSLGLRPLRCPVKIRHSFGREQLAGCGQLGATLMPPASA